MREKKEENRFSNVSKDQKAVIILGAVALLMIIVPFILYVVGAISKLTMTLIFLIPVALVAAQFFVVKKRSNA